MPLQAGTSNRTALRIVPEVTFGVTPATPAFQNLRYTGESLAYNIKNIVSNEIRADRMTTDLIQVGADVSGDINVELSMLSFDTLIAAALCSDFGAPVANVSTIKNGVLLKSFTVQKHFQDLAVPLFQNFIGCRVGGMSLDFKSGSILTGSFKFMGLQASIGTTQVAGATFSSPGDGRTPFNAVANLTNIEKDDVAFATKIKSMTMDLNNNLRGQEAIGVLGYAGIALGKLDINGNIELYFENITEYNSFLANDDFKLEFMVVDGADSYKFTFPRVKYEAGTILSGGLDQDLMVNGTWRAIYDSVSTCMIQIDKTDVP